MRTVAGAIALLLAFALYALGAPGHAQNRPADKRIALVIGNADYPKLRLGNPENDARLVAANLRQLGFEVNEQLNIGVLQFRRVLRDFARKVQQDDAIAVLYYAGHGMQIDGRNYLLPVDINLRDQEEVKDESVDIDELFLSRIDKVGSHPRIIILDACRDNPFGNKKTRNIASGGGLAEMGARGTLIAFASAPGAPAEDGPDGSNSIYTKSLAREMMTPGIEVEQMFKNVRVRVLRETAGRQLPWVNTSLTSDFSFNPAASRPAAAQVQPAPSGQGARPEAAPAPAPLTAAREPVPRDKDIETLLARAQREAPLPSSATATAAPPPAVLAEPVPSAPAPAAAAAPLPATPAPELQGPKVALAAPRTTPSSAAALSASGRKFLDRDEVQRLLVDKKHTLRNTGVDNFYRLDLRSSGIVYFNSMGSTQRNTSVSGRWELRDDGSLCTKFNAALLGQPTDATRAEDGCWYFFREGDKLLRVSATAKDARPQAEIVNIQ